jgi:hypothetical protein
MPVPAGHTRAEHLEKDECVRLCLLRAVPGFLAGVRRLGGLRGRQLVPRGQVLHADQHDRPPGGLERLVFLEHDTVTWEHDVPGFPSDESKHVDGAGLIDATPRIGQCKVLPGGENPSGTSTYTLLTTGPLAARPMPRRPLRNASSSCSRAAARRRTGVPELHRLPAQPRVREADADAARATVATGKCDRTRFDASADRNVFGSSLARHGRERVAPVSDSR